MHNGFKASVQHRMYKLADDENAMLASVNSHFVATAGRADLPIAETEKGKREYWCSQYETAASAWRFKLGR